MKKYCIDNERMLDALMMYCEGKSCLWNALFGRKRTYFRNGEWAYSIYMIPERVYTTLNQFLIVFISFISFLIL